MSDEPLIPVYAFQPTPALAPGVVREREADEGFYLSLALGLIVESARASAAVAARYDFDTPVSFSEEELLEAVRSRGPGVCLFSSYVWNVEANRAASRAVKAQEPRCVTIHGGPSTPKYAEIAAAFLRDNAHVDVAVRGEGEVAIGELLTSLAPVFGASSVDRARALGRVAGITFLDASGGVVRTDERARVDDLSAVPSPYLTGYFDRVLRDRAGRGRSRSIYMATLETNRGCPYQCTFCDWGSLTLQKIRTFPLERVRAELDWIGRHEVERIFLGDANFGILPRDVEMAAAMADTRRRLGYPRDVTANYAKNGSELLTKVFELWQAAGITFDPSISIQTTDTDTLRVVRRSNIKAKKYLELSAVYRDMGLAPRVHLMMGLPGQTLAAWKNDLQFVFSRQETPQIFPTRMLPNSPMAEPAYIREHGLRIDERGTIIESTAFTEAEWHEMGRIACAYTVFQSWSVLRFVLMHLEWDHGLRAIDVIHDYSEAAWLDSAAFPRATELLRPLLEVRPDELFAAKNSSFRRFHEDGWETLLDEFAGFAEARYGAVRDGALEVALRVQAAVLPRSGAPASQILELEHDFVAYARLGCAAMLRGERPTARLDTFAAAPMTVLDEDGRTGPFKEARLEEVQATLLRSPDAPAPLAVVSPPTRRYSPIVSDDVEHASEFASALGLGHGEELAEHLRVEAIVPGRRIEVKLARGDERVTLYLERLGPEPCYAQTKLFQVRYRTPERGAVPLAVVDAFVARLAAAETKLSRSLLEALRAEPDATKSSAARPSPAPPTREGRTEPTSPRVRRPLAILGQTDGIPKRSTSGRLRVTLVNVCEESFGYGPAASEYLRAKLLSVPELAAQIDVSVLFLGGTDCPAFAEQIAEQDPDLVGFTCYSWNLASTAETTRLLRRKMGGAGGRPVVVWGGTSFALLRERHDWFEWWSDVDAVAIGSGEQTIVDIVARLLTLGPGHGLGDGPIRGTMRSVDGRLVIGEPALSPATLAEVPSPYQMNTAIRVQRPFIEMARGCVLQCAFCSDARVSREGRWLTASVDHIARDVAAVVAWPETTDVSAGASTANMTEAVFAEMCEGIRRGDPGQRLSYGLQIYPSLARPSLREALRGVRLRRIGIGVQSLTPDTWRPMRRKTSIEHARKSVALLSDLGTIYLTVLLGMPGETYESFVSMLEELLAIEGSFIVVHRLLILPGTQFHQQHEHFGLRFDPDKYYRVTSSPTMSSSDLLRAQHYVRNRSAQVGFGPGGGLRLDWTNADDMPLSFDSPATTQF